jgi:threonine/homoserine/homoserine lactone efflux protein
MPSLGTFLAFSAAALALIVVPGPAVIYIVGRSVSQGRDHGLVSALGVATGGLVHVLAAALGVSVLVARSAVAFSTLKFAGAAYLVYLGIQKLRRPSQLSAAANSDEQAAPLGRTYTHGVVVNVLNPKTALFFLALLPQFVDPDRGPTAPQVVVLGLSFVVLALGSDCGWALASSAAATRLRRSERALRHLDRGAGAIFIGLGLLAAVGHRSQTEH